MKKTAVITAMLIVPLLTGCDLFKVDGFKNEEAKRHAWDVYQCNEYLDQGAVLAAWLLTLETAPEDREIADRYRTELMNAKKVREVMPRDPDGMCRGWLWENKKNSALYLDGYDEFTYQKMDDAGYVNHN